jgi:hypothetical protein
MTDDDAETRDVYLKMTVAVCPRSRKRRSPTPCAIFRAYLEKSNE